MPREYLKESSERESSLETNFYNFLEDENIDESGKNSLHKYYFFILYIHY
jgi:hypothetical protein